VFKNHCGAIIFQNSRSNGGRPKGSRDLRSKSERLLDRLMNSRGDNLTRIVDGVLAMAEAGESWAAKAVLDRCWAVPRGRMVRLNQQNQGDTVCESYLHNGIANERPFPHGGRRRAAPAWGAVGDGRLPI
jgi:hypothetical protein